MGRFRWIAMTIMLPVLYAGIVVAVTRKPKIKPVYTFAQPTVVTVTE